MPRDKQMKWRPGKSHTHLWKHSPRNVNSYNQYEHGLPPSPIKPSMSLSRPSTSPSPSLRSPRSPRSPRSRVPTSPRSETILHMHKSGVAVEGRLTSPVGVEHLWRERENGWIDRNPVWDNYIPEYRGENSEPGITFCKSYSQWKNGRLMPTGGRGPMPKVSPMLFNNSMGWNRVNYDPDASLLSDPMSYLDAGRPQLNPQLKTSKARLVDTFTRPPKISFVDTTQPSSVRLPDILPSARELEEQQLASTSEATTPKRHHGRWLVHTTTATESAASLELSRGRDQTFVEHELGGVPEAQKDFGSTVDR